MKKLLLLTLALAICCWVVAGATVNRGTSLSDKAPVVTKAAPATNNQVTASVSYDEAQRIAEKIRQENPEKKDSGVATPPDQNVILQGGDTFASATVIPSLPYTDAGTTTGYTHDYSGTCISSSAPDVVYSYAPSVAQSIDVSLCVNTTWDTGLIIFANDVSNQVGCNDDGCSVQSLVSGLAVTPGNTYYIVVTGYSSNNGPYELNVTAYTPPTCTPDMYVTLPAAMPYADANTTCGKVNDFSNTCLGSYDGGEDMIYEVTVTSTVNVDIVLDPGTDTWTGIAIDGTCPPNPSSCIAVSTLSTAAPHGFYSMVLDPGTYYIMIDTWPTPNCIAAYTLSIDEAAAAPANDECTAAEAITGPYPVDVTGTTVGATVDCPGVLDWNAVWYTIDLPYASNNLSIDYCPTTGAIQTVGIVYYNDCFDCNAYVIADAYAFVTCPSSVTNPQLNWNDVPGPTTVYFPVYVGAPMDFGFTVNVNEYTPPSADFTVTAPGSWTGSICGAGDNCILRVAEDQIYEITCPDAGSWTFSLCATDPQWDSYIYLGTSICSSDISSNDDFCSSYGNGQITTNLAAGTYYLTIEGYSSADCGDYVLDVTYNPPVDITCPTPNTPEGEPDCGGAYVDNYNGGCNSTPAIFSTITCGETICGTSGTNDVGRDTDWYRLDLSAEGGDLTWTAVGEFPILIFIIDANGDDCSNPLILGSATADPGVEATVTWSVNPGIYYLWVGPSTFTDWPCPLEYYATLTCDTGTPIYSINPTSANGSAPVGGSDTDVLTVSNIGTRTLTFDVTIQQNDVITSRPGPAQTTSNKDDNFVVRKELGTPHPSDPNVILQGGDNTGDATVITALPYDDDGTTVGYTDDFDGSCGSTGSSAPDVVYSYTPATDVIVSADLCLTSPSWDTRMYVADASLNELNCNDDFCGLLSGVSNVALSAGATYYFIIDGYGVNSGAYHFHMEEFIPCVVECPTPNTPEGEVDCYDEYDDLTNSGCNASTGIPVFGAVSPGETICGSTGVYSFAGSTYRDTDWFLMNLTGPSLVTVTGTGEVPLILGIVDQPGPDPCPVSSFTAYTVTPACEIGTVTWAVNATGPVILFVAPSAWDLTYACGSTYWVSMQASPLWLSTDVSTGSIPEGGTLPVTVGMDASSLTAGTYTGTVYFNTNETISTLHEVPVNFVVSSGGVCQYVVGDVNNNAAFNGIDVTYGVSYFKGGNVPPYSCVCGSSTWYVAGDVNASCVFNGIDITYMVSYFKGGPAPHPCPTCPPTSIAKVPSLSPKSIQIGGNQ